MRGSRDRSNLDFDKEGFLEEITEDTNENHMGDTEPFVQDAQEPGGEEEQERTMTSGDAAGSAGARLPGMGAEEGDAGGEDMQEKKNRYQQWSQVCHPRLSQRT